MNYNRNKRNSGITLVALVITIIMLLILAGVTINLTLGDNGILKHTESAKEEDRRQTASETMRMKITTIQMKNYAEKQSLPSLQELADGLCEDDEMEYVLLESKKNASLDKISVGLNKSIFTKIKSYPYEFEIDSSLQLASIDGVKLANNDDKVTITREEYNSLLERIGNLEDSSGKREKLVREDFEPIEIKTENKDTVIGMKIALEKPIDEYKYIEFQVDMKQENPKVRYINRKTIFVAVDSIKCMTEEEFKASNQQDYFTLTSEWSSNSTTLGCYFQNNTTLCVDGARSNHVAYTGMRILNICGVK